MLSHIPGVKSVAMRDVRVHPVRVSDREIAKTIRTLLKRASNLESSKLSIEVENGRVALAGFVRDRAEMEQAIGLIGHVRGVRDIRNLTSTSPAGKLRDSLIARRLRRLLRYRFPGEQVRVDVFGGVAALRGRVKRLSTRRDVAELVARDEAVRRILNKIEVV
jgi:osmotically-inducible protein OsmY